MSTSLATAAPAQGAPGLTPAQASAVRALGASAGGASASKLLGLLYDPDVDVDRILQCLHAEPVLAARVLKVANAPYYGQSGRVGSVQRAVALLGLSAIRGIAAAGALDRLTPARAGNPFDTLRFRRHSGAVAVAAQALSRKAGCDIDGEAFLAGLLHDIGVLLLVKADPAAMASFDLAAAAHASQGALAEQQHFGLAHEEAGAILIDAWALPPWLKAAVAAHHQMPEGQTPGQGLQALPALLCLAEQLAAQAGFGLWPRCAQAAQATQEIQASFGFQTDTLAELAQGLPPALQALGLDA